MGRQSILKIAQHLKETVRELLKIKEYSGKKKDETKNEKKDLKKKKNMKNSKQGRFNKKAKRNVFHIFFHSSFT